MQLIHIIYNTCTTCGAEATDFRVNALHCNGQWNEYVQFKCGAEDHYSPNFNKIETIRFCPKKCKKVNFNFLVKLEVTVPPGTTLDDIALKESRDAQWYWDKVFDLPWGVTVSSASLVKKRIVKRV